MTDNIVEVIQQLAVPRYAPRIKPTPIPGAAWNEAPLFCLKLNDEWVSHVLGVMTALDQPDTWQGTDEEIIAVRQQVNEIMVAFMQMCEEPMLELRVEDCDLQYRESEADEWISLGNVCGATGDTGPQGEPGETGEAGMDGANGINGSDGATGATGSEGPEGPPGVDGTNCSCDDYPAPTPPEGQADTQTSCNIAGNIVDNLLFESIQQAKNASDNSLSNAKFVINLLAVLGAAASGTIVVPIMTTVASALLGVVIASLDQFAPALGDDGFWADLRCLVYCALKPNSDIDEGIQATITSAIRAGTYAGTGYDADFIRNTLADYFGGIPLPVIRSNAIVGAFGAYDCSGCTDCPTVTEWCYTFDFTTTDGGFSGPYGTWVDGVGWQGTAAGGGVSIVLSRAFTGHVTDLAIDMVYGGSTGNLAAGVNDFESPLVINAFTVSTGTFTGMTDRDATSVDVNPSAGAGPMTMTRLTLMGTGDNPFGADNCP